MHYKTVFLSDLHLGSKKAKAKHILSFLEKNTFENIYLVGDIIDIWRFKQFHSMSKKKQNTHMKCVSRLIQLGANGCNITYIIGNHDEHAIKMFRDHKFGNIRFKEHCSYTDSVSRKWKVIHGHQYDLITKYKFSKSIGKLGDFGYDILISINEIFNKIRSLFGYKYWSMSKYIKIKVKKAANFLQRFEDIAVELATKEGYHGVITGHIHDPKITDRYVNCGCWTDIANLNFVYDNGNGLILSQWKEMEVNNE